MISSYHIISIISYQSYQPYHINHINHIIYHISYIIYHISYIIYHISYIIYHLSYHIISYHVSYHISISHHIISYNIIIVSMIRQRMITHLNNCTLSWDDMRVRSTTGFNKQSRLQTWIRCLEFFNFSFPSIEISCPVLSAKTTSSITEGSASMSYEDNTNVNTPYIHVQLVFYSGWKGGMVYQLLLRK